MSELLVARYGMSPDEARAANAGVAGLAASEGLAYRIDTARPGNPFDAQHAVPYFVFDRRVAVAGAQSVDAFSSLREAAWTRGNAVADASPHA